MRSSRQVLTSIVATLATAGACAIVTICFLPRHVTPLKSISSVDFPETTIQTVEQSGRITSRPPQEVLSTTAPGGSMRQNSAVPASMEVPIQQQRQALPPADQTYQFTKEELEVFSSLPPMCTTDLQQHLKTDSPPGLASKPSNANEVAADFNSQSKPAPIKDWTAPRTPRSPEPGFASAQIAARIEMDDSLPNQFAPPEAEQQPVQSTADSALTNSFAQFIDHPTVANKRVEFETLGQGSSVHGSPHSKQFDPHVHPAHQTLETNPAHSQVQPASFNSSSEGNAGGANEDADETDPHMEIYSRTPFPSAIECAKCHKQIYEEWASSSHAYASISPMFHVFEDTLNRLSQGTVGYFCYRCHSPVSTTMGLRRDQPIWDGPPVFREGVTCVACHRVKVPYGKVDGERRIEPGDIYEPVYGAGDGRGVAIADKYREYFKVKTEQSEKKTPGQAMHRRSIQFEELSKSSFCMSCHQVAVEPGIKLEVVWDQYRASPAYRQGVTCQDCHMGRVPGVDEGYSVGPGAIVNDRVINPEKKHSNHIFYGPGYSIAHPGIFPHTVEGQRWTVPQWLEFDWRAGWGTDEFEDALADGRFNWQFPEAWKEVDDRYDAREIVDANLEKLKYKLDLRRQVLENGSKVDGPFFNEPPRVNQPLKVRYCITNLNPGHNMPSGSLGAQPQIWVNAVLIDPNGRRVWETGYLDSNGDLADNHSLDVLARKVPLDTQLVNFQTKFLTTNVKGTDREMYLPVNFDIDQIPFLRPPQQPVSVINHPPFIRMEGHSIPPLGKRNAKFSIPARRLHVPGTYRLSIRLRSRAEPIYFMRFCNATPEMQRMMNEWICDFHVSTVAFEVH